MCASRCTLIRGRDSMSLRNAHMCGVHVHALLHLRDFSFRVPHSLSQSQKPYIYTRPVQRFSEDISTQAGDSPKIYRGTMVLYTPPILYMSDLARPSHSSSVASSVTAASRRQAAQGWSRCRRRAPPHQRAALGARAARSSTRGAPRVEPQSTYPYTAGRVFRLRARETAASTRPRVQQLGFRVAGTKF